MIGALHLAVGLLPALLGWALPRRIVGARVTGPWPLLVDLFPPLLCWGLVLCLTGRPVFAGAVVLVLGAGLSLFDRVKREVLREPAVFSDIAELPQLFTHPHLYLPFAGTGLVLGGAAAALLFGLIVFDIEPPLWRLGLVPLLLPTAIVCALAVALSRQPTLGWIAAALRHLGPEGDPAADMVRLGPFATLFAHGTIAAAERQVRRASIPLPAVIRRAEGALSPVVLVQCESFFDARRLSPLLPQDLLPGFDAVRAAAVSGRLEVPGWGANTMRAEFAALTGTAEDALGLDRFNPYYAFVRMPTASLAWQLRRQGYRTVCLHPFDRRFFRRDRAMPALGFERFLGRESIGGGRRPPYCPDPELARHILEVVAAEGPGVFVFAITMGNHGPWAEAPYRLRDVPAELPGAAALQRYLDGLRRSDEMIEILRRGLARHRDALFGFYGDHPPSLPHTFRHFGFDEWTTDYFVWRDGLAPRRLDVPAHRLPAVLLETLTTGTPAEQPAA